VLGTAQLGAPYGSVRKTPAPSRAQSVAIVRAAIRYGVTHIDTARCYSGSEERLGAALADGWINGAQVITKLSLLEDVPANASEGVVFEAVDASISQSRKNLGLSTLPVLLLHRAAHLCEWGGAAWRRLKQLQRDGEIGALGASVQSVEEAKAALAVTEVHHIQLAYNILDTRWDDAGIPALAASRPEVVVHVRSALLQGVLLERDADAWPKIDGLEVTALSDWLAGKAASLGRRNVADLCYAWLRAQSWIDAIVVGMESESQVRDNAALFATPDLDGSALEEIARTRPVFPLTLLNPALWSKAT